MAGVLGRVRAASSGAHAGFDAWLPGARRPPLPDGRDYIYESPCLNLYLYPARPDYAREPAGADLAPARVERARTDEPCEVQRRSPAARPARLPSLGSLGSADVELMQRLIDVLADRRTA